MSVADLDKVGVAGLGKVLRLGCERWTQVLPSQPRSAPANLAAMTQNTQPEGPWVMTRDRRIHRGTWVPGAFQAEDGTLIKLDEIIDSDVGPMRDA